ncbi:HD domain-containing protein [Desulfofalx alkaliphila]|uniref:HD domain-containing protein n=1 Tax=Desulfofalx alkaliphila TaxID=105483 RepID=UPI0004E282AA|nr:HD domain-containing protein [Desulfofalx alkaliphila]
MITLEDVKANPIIDACIRKGNQFLGAMGFTEHSYRHINLVSSIAREIIEKLGYSKEDAELAAIAGYLHDVGNVISRNDHGISGANIVFPILLQMGMPPDDVATVVSAIANHEEQYGHPVNHVAAALIIADKSDVHRSRVRNTDFATFDIHDRVNYAAEQAYISINEETRTITMELNIDIAISSPMEYFEIFLDRMILCRRAAAHLGCSFELVINGSKLI